MRFLLLLLLPLLLGLAPAPSTGTQHFVSPTGSDDNNGNTIEAPFKTIQHAINQAESNDIILLEEGTYDSDGGDTCNQNLLSEHLWDWPGDPSTPPHLTAAGDAATHAKSGLQSIFLTSGDVLEYSSSIPIKSERMYRLRSWVKVTYTSPEILTTQPNNDECGSVGVFATSLKLSFPCRPDFGWQKNELFFYSDATELSSLTGGGVMKIQLNMVTTNDFNMYFDDVSLVAFPHLLEFPDVYAPPSVSSILSSSTQGAVGEGDSCDSLQTNATQLKTSSYGGDLSPYHCEMELDGGGWTLLLSSGIGTQAMHETTTSGSSASFVAFGTNGGHVVPHDVAYCKLFYCNANTDLRNAYCDGGVCTTAAHAASCYKHWGNSGKTEGRLPDLDECMKKPENTPYKMSEFLFNEKKFTEILIVRTFVDAKGDSISEIESKEWVRLSLGGAGSTTPALSAIDILWKSKGSNSMAWSGMNDRGIEISSVVHSVSKNLPDNWFHDSSIPWTKSIPSTSQNYIVELYGRTRRGQETHGAMPPSDPTPHSEPQHRRCNYNLDLLGKNVQIRSVTGGEAEESNGAAVIDCGLQWPQTATEISAGESRRGFLISSGETSAVLGPGLIIQGCVSNNQDLEGAGVMIANGVTARLNKVLIRSCHSVRAGGGGIFVSGSDLTLEDVQVENCGGHESAVQVAGGSGTLVWNGGKLNGNRAESSALNLKGALSVTSGSSSNVIISNVKFEQNHIAVVIEDGSPALSLSFQSCIFQHNRPQIASHYTINLRPVERAAFESCNFANNTGEGGGGGGHVHARGPVRPPLVELMVFGSQNARSINSLEDLSSRGWRVFDGQNALLSLTELSGVNDNNAKNLVPCIGECDNDGQCAAGLQCFQRTGTEPIPGCLGSGDNKWDYCYYPIGHPSYYYPSIHTDTAKYVPHPLFVNDVTTHITADTAALEQGLLDAGCGGDFMCFRSTFVYIPLTPPRLSLRRLTLKGSGGTQSESAATCENIKNENRAARCCTNGGERVIDADIGNICAVESFVANFERCAKYGFRVCTLSEMRSGTTQGAGCDFDAAQVWTSDSCDITETAENTVGQEHRLGYIETDLPAEYVNNGLLKIHWGRPVGGMCRIFVGGKLVSDMHASNDAGPYETTTFAEFQANDVLRISGVCSVYSIHVGSGGTTTSSSAVKLLNTVVDSLYSSAGENDAINDEAFATGFEADPSQSFGTCSPSTCGGTGNCFSLPHSSLSSEFSSSSGNLALAQPVRTSGVQKWFESSVDGLYLSEFENARTDLGSTSAGNSPWWAVHLSSLATNSFVTAVSTLEVASLPEKLDIYIGNTWPDVGQIWSEVQAASSLTKCGTMERTSVNSFHHVYVGQCVDGGVGVSGEYVVLVASNFASLATSQLEFSEVTVFAPKQNTLGMYCSDGRQAATATTEESVMWYVNASAPLYADFTRGGNDASVPLATIQHAINRAQDGDKISLAPGTYDHPSVDSGGRSVELCSLNMIEDSGAETLIAPVEDGWTLLPYSGTTTTTTSTAERFKGSDDFTLEGLRVWRFNLKPELPLTSSNCEEIASIIYGSKVMATRRQVTGDLQYTFKGCSVSNKDWAAHYNTDYPFPAAEEFKGYTPVYGGSLLMQSKKLLYLLPGKPYRLSVQAKVRTRNLWKLLYFFFPVKVLNPCR